MARRPKPNFAICRMCGEQYDLDGTMAGVPGHLAPGEAITTNDGVSIKINLCGFGIEGIVVNPGSPMHGRGFDVLFLVCGRDCAAAIRIAAALDADADGHEVDPGAEGVAWLRRHRPGDALTDRTLKRLELFESALRSAAPHIAERLGFNKPPPQFGPNASPEGSAAAEALLARMCVWCQNPIARGRPRRSLLVWLNDDEPRAESGVVLLKVGDRTIPARLARPGSPEAASCDAIFSLCSKACANELGAAIREEQWMRVVH